MKFNDFFQKLAGDVDDAMKDMGINDQVTHDMLSAEIGELDDNEVAAICARIKKWFPINVVKYNEHLIELPVESVELRGRGNLDIQYQHPRFDIRATVSVEYFDGDTVGDVLCKMLDDHDIMQDMRPDNDYAIDINASLKKKASDVEDAMRDLGLVDDLTRQYLIQKKLDNETLSDHEWSALMVRQPNADWRAILQYFTGDRKSFYADIIERMNRRASASYDEEYGRHSKIPECCIQEFIKFTPEQKAERNNAANAIAEKDGTRLWDYMPCAKCLETKNVVEMHYCQPGCGLEEIKEKCGMSEQRVAEIFALNKLILTASEVDDVLADMNIRVSTQLPSLFGAMTYAQLLENEDRQHDFMLFIRHNAGVVFYRQTSGRIGKLKAHYSNFEPGKVNIAFMNPWKTIDYSVDVTGLVSLESVYNKIIEEMCMLRETKVFDDDAIERRAAEIDDAMRDLGLPSYDLDIIKEKIRNGEPCTPSEYYQLLTDYHVFAKQPDPEDLVGIADNNIATDLQTNTMQYFVPQPGLGRTMIVDEIDAHDNADRPTRQNTRRQYRRQRFYEAVMKPENLNKTAEEIEDAMKDLGVHADPLPHELNVYFKEVSPDDAKKLMSSYFMDFPHIETGPVQNVHATFKPLEIVIANNEVQFWYDSGNPEIHKRMMASTTTYGLLSYTLFRMIEYIMSAYRCVNTEKAVALKSKLAGLVNSTLWRGQRRI